MKKRIAYFTPLSPQQGGISDHSEELLPHLARYADIDIVTSGDYTPDHPAILDHFRIVDDKHYLRDPSAYDAAVYQVGNNLHCHAYMVPCLRAAPGIVVLQDYSLQYLALGMTLGRGDTVALTEALQPVYGDRSQGLVRRLLFGLANPADVIFAYPFLAAGRAIIVHSTYLYELVRRQVPDKPVCNVPMGVSIPPRTKSKQELRRAYGYPDDAFIVVSASTRAPKKRLDIVLTALRDCRGKIPGLRFLVVGGGSPGAKVHRMIREYGLSEIVEQTGWVSTERYQELIQLSDVAIDIRDMSAAETANSALRCLAAGTPVIVSASGTFLEIPDSCSNRIPVDDHQSESLTVDLLALAEDPQRVERMSAAASAFAQASLTMEHQAEVFMAFVDEVIASTSGSGTVRLLEGNAGRSIWPIAGIYRLCRVAYLLRSYGLIDSLRRFRARLASRIGTESQETL